MPITAQQRETYKRHNTNNYCVCPVCRFARQNIVLTRQSLLQHRAQPTTTPTQQQTCCNNCARCALKQKMQHQKQQTVQRQSKPTGSIVANPVSASTLQRALIAVEKTKPISLCKPTVTVVQAKHIIDQRLANIGLCREATTADGNCFFHAVTSMFVRHGVFSNIADANFDVNNFHSVLRQQVCDFVELNYNDLKMIKEIIECEYSNLENFIRVMRQNGTYADGNVANIVSIIYNVNFHIHTYNGVMETNPTADALNLHIVWIGSHWESTRPR